MRGSGIGGRPQPQPRPAANNDIEARIRRLELDLARIGAGMEYLVQQAQEQQRHRTRITWAVGSAVILLVLQSLGLEVSLGG